MTIEEQMSEILNVPILMKLDIQFTDDPDLDSDIIPFCSEECRLDYIKSHPEYTEANFFYESISEDGEEKGMVTCMHCKQTKKATE